jgi:hypothetical protein
MAMTDNRIIHQVAVVLDPRGLCADGNRVRVCERDSEFTTGRSENRPRARFLHVIPDVEFIEVGHPRAFKIAEVDDVVDVPERIHLAPCDGYVDDDRVSVSSTLSLLINFEKIRLRLSGDLRCRYSDNLDVRSLFSGTFSRG